MTSKDKDLKDIILEALPQLQCKKCEYKDCEAYAEAIVNNNESLNLSNLNLVLKISGYWETSKEIGLTYRFFITENV